VKDVETHVVFLQHEFRLQDVRTNPYVFHPTLAGATNLKYGLPEAASVTIDVVDPNGNFLITLQEAAVQPAGVHEITWDGRTAFGEVVATEGVYTIEVRATSQVSAQTHTRRVSALVHR
jgi:flagellar hook assembly protein FlgD